MKVKILTETNYDILQHKFDCFSNEHNVISVSVFEKYDIQADTGYVTYHVFYKDKKDYFTNMERFNLG